MGEIFTIRHATERDQLAIAALVHSERLNPYDIAWYRFMIATDGTGLLGAAQLRMHDDGSRELGSLVVRRDFRGLGIASRLIDALLASVAARVLMITGWAFARHYERWGFRRIEPDEAPGAVRRNYYFGAFLGGAASLLRGRRPRQLAILDRKLRGAMTPADVGCLYDFRRYLDPSNPATLLRQSRGAAQVPVL